MTTFNIEIGKGLTVNVDRDQIDKHAASADHVFKIGMRNVLMDCHAGIKREAFSEGEDGTKAWRDASLEKAMAKLAALYAGDVRANAVTRVSSVDPVEAEARDLARAFYLDKHTGLVRGFEKDEAKAAIVAKLRNALALADDVDAKGVIAAAIKARAAKPEVIEKARKNVAERMAVVTKATADETIDLGV